jgi:hypothetical protein
LPGLSELSDLKYTRHKTRPCRTPTSPTRPSVPTCLWSSDDTSTLWLLRLEKVPPNLAEKHRHPTTENRIPVLAVVATTSVRSANARICRTHTPLTQASTSSARSYSTTRVSHCLDSA